MKKKADPADRVAVAKRAVLEGVGAEIAASFPGTTRLGGQIVAALYIEGEPRSMDWLSAEIGCSKSNVFSNLRGLESAGIVEKRREAGQRHDLYALRGPYPDVVIGAYITRLRRVVADKRALSTRALDLLGDAAGEEADRLRSRLFDLRRKYDRFGEVFGAILPAIDGPVDLERMLEGVPPEVFELVAAMAREAFGVGPRKS